MFAVRQLNNLTSEPGPQQPLHDGLHGGPKVDGVGRHPGGRSTLAQVAALQHAAQCPRVALDCAAMDDG